MPTDATTYDRIGQLIGRAIATTEHRRGADAEAADILASLAGASC